MLFDHADLLKKIGLFLPLISLSACITLPGPNSSGNALNEAPANSGSTISAKLSQYGITNIPSVGTGSVEYVSFGAASGLLSDTTFYRVEAEQMNLTGFTIVTNAAASGGKYIQAPAVGAQAAFSFAESSGEYLVIVVPFFGASFSTSSNNIDLNSILAQSPGAPMSSAIPFGIFQASLTQGAAVDIQSAVAGQTIDFVVVVPVGGSSAAPTPAPTPSSSPTPKPTVSPTPSPTAAAVSFSKSIMPVLSLNCVSCHGGISSYSGASGRVNPGNPGGSSLYQKIVPGASMSGHSPSGFYTTVGTWITQGALNN